MKKFLLTLVLAAVAVGSAVTETETICHDMECPNVIYAETVQGIPDIFAPTCIIIDDKNKRG